MRKTAVPAIAAAALIVGACGSDNDETPPLDTPSVAPTTAIPPTDTEQPDDDGTEGGEDGTDPDGNGSGDGVDETDSVEEPDGDVATEGDFGTERQMTEGWPGSASEPTYLTEIRAARHEGFDRVVFEHEGSPVPQYLVEYTEDARTEGTGQAINVPGSVILAVGVSGVMPPEDLDIIEQGEWFPEAETVLAGVHALPPWEAHARYYVGLDTERGFRVTALEDPARIVVDLEH